MMQRRIAQLPLHGGKAPAWLFSRMSRLTGAITMTIMHRLYTVFITLILISATVSCTSDRQAPEWVRNPRILRQTYPLQRYLVGHGVSGAAGANDLLAKRAAEDMALADIAASIEVRIDSTVERQETEVDYRGELSVQDVVHRHTQRTVSAVLRGAQVKGSYFDPVTYNWYAYAVLDRLQAGALMQHALDAEISGIREELQLDRAAALADYLHDLRLRNQVRHMRTSLHTALIFLPAPRVQDLQEQISTLERQLAERVQQKGSKLTVGIKVNIPSRLELTEQKAELERKMEQLLRVLEIPAMAATDGPTEFRVHIDLQVESLQGSVTLLRAQAQADFVLAEERDILFQGYVKSGAATASRTMSEEHSVAASLRKLTPLLLQEVENSLRSFLHNQPG